MNMNAHQIHSLQQQFPIVFTYDMATVLWRKKVYYFVTWNIL